MYIYIYIVAYGDCKKGVDQENEAIATGAYNLADIIYRQNGDLIRAEELARECLRIRTLLYDSGHNSVGLSCSLLASILGAQGNLGSETRALFDYSLSVSILNAGPDGMNRSTLNYNMGAFHDQRAIILFRGSASNLVKHTRPYPSEFC
jgi:hypothetical protein